MQRLWFNEVGIFTEESGNKVLYDPTRYRIENNCLYYEGESETPIQPIGCTSYCKMFQNRRNRRFFNLENWDVSNGENFSQMFSDCWNLQSLNLKNWDVSNASYLACMFAGCWNLQSLNVENWDVSKVTYFSCIFGYCTNLQSLNVENWKINIKAKIDSMFNKCKKLFQKYQVEDSDELVEKIFKKKQ